MSGLSSRLEAIWYGDSTPPWILRVLASLYAVALNRRRPFNAERLPAPVLVVGNFTVGGTGKTPLIIALAEHLRERGYRPGVVSRGYGRRQRQPHSVVPGSTPQQAGDEPLLIARRTGVPVRVDADRLAAARFLIAQGCDVIVADDGLQHRNLPRMLEIEVLDAARGYGNGRLLPAGPLREPVRAVDLRVANGAAADADDAYAMSMRPGLCRNLRDGRVLPLDRFRGQTVQAVAGIGNPERFFSSLRQSGLAVDTHVFPDHHAFRTDDLPGGTVLLTEKDAVKCAPFAHADVWAVPVEARLSDAFFERLAALLPAARSMP